MKHLKLFEQYNSDELLQDSKFGKIKGAIAHDIYGIADIFNKYGDSQLVLEILEEEYGQELYPISILENINININYRGMGKGKELYSEYERWAVMNQCQYSILVSDKGEKQLDGFVLDNWYRSLGYTKIANLSDNSVMIKDLI
jgi:hypothetical protein